MVTSGGSVTASGAGTTIALNDDGYFELSDGTRYTCTSPDGCTVANGTVTRGTVTGRAAGSGEVDRFPTFRTAVSPDDQTYTVGTAIDTLTLPEASSGNAPLSYRLTPSVPGLTFNATTLQLTGTPSTAGTYAMRYTVTDEDGDADTRSFTITVNPDSSEPVTDGDCYVGLLVRIGESCTYPSTMDAFSVNERGRGSFLTFLAGIRIRINNQTINGRVYDLMASHQGEGVWRIDRVAGSTEPPTDGGEIGTDQELYRGVRVAPENRCSEYDSGDYSYPQSIEDQIVAAIGKFTVRTRESVLPRREKPTSSISSPGRRRTTAGCVLRALPRRGHSRRTSSI